jgi:hypothetical protein
MRYIAVLLVLFLFSGCALFDKGKDKLNEEKDEWLADHNFGTPEDEPEEEPFPESEPNNLQYDMRQVKQTVTIANGRWTGTGVAWDHVEGEDRRKAWPGFGGDLNGHLGLILENQYQCGIDHVRIYGKNGYNNQAWAAFKHHGNLLEGPLEGWSASPGEKIGLFLFWGGWSYTLNKGIENAERSNVIWLEYPR